MWKKIIKILSLILLAIALSCGESGSKAGGSSPSADDIEDTAVSMPNFPKEADITEPETVEINGKGITTGDNAELDKTDSDSTYVAVTLPSNLSRAAVEGETNIEKAYLWLNGVVTELTFTVNGAEVVVGAIVPLDKGDNYFLIFVTTLSGGKFRTPTLKQTRVSDDGNGSNNSVVGKWRVKMIVEDKGLETETTTYFPIQDSDEDFIFIMDNYYEFTESSIRYYYYEKVDTSDDMQAYYPDSEIFEYCPDDDMPYTVSDGKIVIEGEFSGTAFSLNGDIMTILIDETTEEVFIRDSTLDLSTAVENCDYR